MCLDRHLQRNEKGAGCSVLSNGNRKRTLAGYIAAVVPYRCCHFQQTVYQPDIVAGPARGQRLVSRDGIGCPVSSCIAPLTLQTSTKSGDYYRAPLLPLAYYDDRIANRHLHQITQLRTDGVLHRESTDTRREDRNSRVTVRLFFYDC